MADAELLAKLAEQVKSLPKQGTKIISLIGGAGSGKTTLAQKLVEALDSADALSTDDYVVGDRDYRRTHIEGNNPTLKYDPKFLNQKIEQICALRPGEFVAVPTYDERTGIAIAAGEENYRHKVGQVNYLIIEGDFDFVEHPDFRIYLHVSDEVRLENRINRDTQTRNESDAQKIIDNFHLRNKLQHIPHTLPAKGKADVVIEATPIKTEDRTDFTYTIARNSAGLTIRMPS